MLNYKYILYPNKSCINRLESTLEACRFVYNYFIDNKYTNEYDMNNMLVELKELYPWLRNYHSKMLQMVSKHVANVVKALKELKNGYKIGSIKLKDKDEYNTFIYNQSGFKLVNNDGKYYLWLSKIGYIRINMHRDIPDNCIIKQVMVTRKNDKWYALFALEQVYPVFQFIPINLNNIVALDMNSTNNKFIVASNNDNKEFDINNERMERRLKLMQRKLSRRKKDSSNYNKTRNRLQIIHERIERRRKDLLHKVSRYYANKYNIVIVEEDLNVKNMLEDESLPRGNNTYRNIMNKAFNRFIQLLSYKTKIIKVDPKYTTKECYRCGNIQNTPLDKRIYKCSKCGLVIDRDRNSSLNILKKGLMEIGLIHLWYEIMPTPGARGSYACGDLARSMKQEASLLMAGRPIHLF